jgi:hypothetical protein
MATTRFFTVGKLAAKYERPEWLLRRIVDSFGLELPRAGQYRLVPSHLLGRIEQELRRRGYAPQEVAEGGGIARA